MRTHPPATARRWQATIILTLFFFAVAGAAAIGWWYARESPPHQGPIVLISVDRMPAATTSDSTPPERPAIDALAADSVVFDRAYAHSPQLLPAHASLLSGRLPIEHGVRDDVGFALRADVRTLAEHLRNRGFSTGAAVSSFLLRPASGVAQGFAFYDAELPDADDAQPALEREARLTLDAAERWVRTQNGQRFFLFVQVDQPDADATVTRLAQLLKERGLYDNATIVLVGDRGETASGLLLDDASIHVPLMVKQPGGQGAGRRVAVPVQHIDLLPTILDLVRAPRPDDVRGRSLRGVLDDRDTTIPDDPIYSESLTAYFRVGGRPLVALTNERFRYVRGMVEDLSSMADAGEPVPAADGSELTRLRAWLDRLLSGRTIDPPAAVPAHDETRFARLGYLGSLRSAPDTPVLLDDDEQRAVVETQSSAAMLAGQKDYAAAVRQLQAIVREYPALAHVHYQIGVLLMRSGRIDEAIDAFGAAAELRPDAPEPAIALTEILIRTGDHPKAEEQAELAVALAENGGARDLAAAHEVAARAAVARRDPEAAARHAQAVQAADPRIPMAEFIRGRLLYEEGSYADAAAAFGAAEAVVRENGTALADLHLYFGETLAQLNRYADAEAQFRDELHAFPNNAQAYASLAMLYHASSREPAVAEVLEELLHATPTPEGYGMAARLWMIVGERSRADALTNEARTRFRGDPSLALLGRDARQ